MTSSATTPGTTSGAVPRLGVAERAVLLLVAAMALAEPGRALLTALRSPGASPGAPGALLGGALLGSAVVMVAVPRLRHHRLLPLATALSSPVVAAALAWDPIVLWSASTFMAFVAAARRLPWWLVAAATASANAFAVLLTSASHHRVPGLAAPTSSAYLGALLAPCVAALLGHAVALQREQLRSAERRALELADMHRAREAAAVARERLRIARDLHDGVGHQVAVLSMHLGAAEVHAATDPGALRGDLAAARESVQGVLAETQAVLRLLRETDGAARGSRPVASHDRLTDLVEEARVGAEVETVLTGLDTPMDPQASAAVYRITEEALTNALRHGTGWVRLSVSVSGGQVRIDVVNAIGRLRKGTDSGTGFGLVGAHERAASVGGTVTTTRGGAAGRRTFALTAVIPTHPVTDPPTRGST